MFSEKSTNYVPTEDDRLSGSPLSQTVRITVTASVNIPLDATIQNGCILLATGREIAPSLGLLDFTNGDFTMDETEFPNYGVAEIEYVDTTIVPID